MVLGAEELDPAGALRGEAAAVRTFLLALRADAGIADPHLAAPAERLLLEEVADVDADADIVALEERQARRHADATVELVPGAARVAVPVAVAVIAADAAERAEPRHTIIEVRYLVRRTGIELRVAEAVIAADVAGRAPLRHALPAVAEIARRAVVPDAAVADEVGVGRAPADAARQCLQARRANVRRHAASLVEDVAERAGAVAARQLAHARRAPDRHAVAFIERRARRAGLRRRHALVPVADIAGRAALVDAVAVAIDRTARARHRHYALAVLIGRSGRTAEDRRRRRRRRIGHLLPARAEDHDRAHMAAEKRDCPAGRNSRRTRPGSAAGSGA